MRDITSCPECNRKVRVPDELLGQKVKCPSCGCMFTGRIDDSASGAAGAEYPHQDAPTYQFSDRDYQRNDYDARYRDERAESLEDQRYDRPRDRRPSLKPHRGTTILILGILGFFFFWPVPGIIAWVMGQNDLAEMKAGRMDPAGEANTNAGRICGMISVLGYSLIFGCCFFWAIAMISVR